MFKNPFKSLYKRDWIILFVSLSIIVLSNLFSGGLNFLTFSATIIGVVSLIFLAKGNVWGQILMIVFSILYAVNSFRFHYYGEVVTYLGMTMPMSVFALVSWIKNPSGDGRSVKIKRLRFSESLLLIAVTAAVTCGFFFLLRYFGTPNILFSTISIATSFIAAALTFLRSSWYALGYSANDIVLIILWILAAKKDKSYVPLIFCFAVFFANDFYGFLSWKSREKLQSFATSDDS